MNIIADLMKSVSWKMERFPLFGRTHLTYLFIGLTVCVAAAYLLKNKSDGFTRKMFAAVSVYFIIAEVFKQLFCYYAVGYDKYIFILLPFHLCSMPMYILPITLFTRDGGAVKQPLYNFLAGYCLTGGLMSVTVDGGLISGYRIITFHSFVWHFMLIFIALYLCVSGRVRFSLLGFMKSAFVFGICACIALIINVALYGVSNGTCDMFFIGPAPMNVAVYRDIAKAVGRPLTSLIYLSSLTAAAFGLYAAVTHLPKVKKDTGDFV